MTGLPVTGLAVTAAAPVPVFVLGTGRCGSTLVHEVLARHHGTGFVTNLDDLGIARSAAWQNRAWRRLPAAITTKGGARFAPSEGYRVLSKEVSPILVDPVRDLTGADATPWLQARMREFVKVRAQRLDAPVFLHKFTGWPRSGFLRQCFPEAVFVEVVRDGRAVANSWLQMPWWAGHRGPSEWHFGPLSEEFDELWRQHDRSFAVLAGLGWRMLMDSFDQARAEVSSERWLTVRYEDIVASPQEGFAAVLSHLGLEFDSGFAAGLARYRFGSGRTDAFRTDLSPADVNALTAVMAEQLTARGYRL